MTEKELIELIEKAAKQKIKSLDLSWLLQDKFPPEIGNLTNIELLDLSGNKLTEIPPEIWNLTNLVSLNFSQNRIIEIPSEIGKFINLQYLDFWGNRLKILPIEIGRLNNLKYLDIIDNELIKLVPEVGYLANLQYLYLWDNRLTELPQEIGNLTNLKSLDIRNNNLKKLPPEIGNLTNLKSLELWDNQLTELPPEVGKLTNLEFLFLDNNKLTELPPEIGNLTNLEELELRGNPLSSLPPELRRREDGIEILNFYRQKLEQGTDLIYEAKLLIVGEGGAGKTTLAKKIEDENYELISTEQSTEGIDIIRWKFPFKDDKEFTVNIWDFGGQEIYHSTHQFFLTKRSLYILVADSRKEDTDFFYWLNVVDLLSETSPILIVKNEKQDRKREINERQLRGEFTNLEKVLATNLANNRGLSTIKQAIEHYITTLSHIGDELPKTWIKVRRAIETNPHNHITLEEYLEICKENGFTEREDALQLSEYLHDLGVCLHFQKDDLLRKTVILKPTWGTDAAYRVLDNPQVIQNLGRFDQADLAAIWHEEQYATMRPELLRLMMNFKLCYEIPSHPKNYIAPQLLNPNQPDYLWDETDNLFLRYAYEFMPKGILTRFIVEMHQSIENQTCVWKTGVVLCEDYARAEVIELYHRREIRIRVCGQHKRDLLTKIRHEFDKIHATYKRLKCSTLVPCNCETCENNKKNNQDPHFYPLKTLYEFQNDKNQKQIQCLISAKMVNINPLINDLIKDSREVSETMSDSGRYQINNPKNVFINDQNTIGQQIGEQHNYASDPRLKKAVDEIVKILTKLQEDYPDATDPEVAREIIDVEFEEVRTEKPAKWKMITQQLLDRDRWLNGGKAAILAALEHLTEESIFGKTGVAFLEAFSEKE